MDFKPMPSGGNNIEESTSEEIVQRALGSVARGGALIFIGLATFKIFNFIRQLIIIRLLSPSDYGLFSLGMTVITIYMIFGTLGLHSGSQRFIAFFEARGNESRTRGVIVSTLRIIVFSAAVSTVLSILLAGPLSGLFDKPDEKQVLVWFTALVPLSIGIQIMSSFFMGFKRASYSVFVERIGLSVVSTVMMVLFLIMRRNLTYVLVAQVLSHTLVFTIGLAYAVRHFPIRIRDGERVLMGKELLAFSLPLLASSALGFLMAQTDTLMLGYYAPSEQVGFYNAAYLLAIVLPIFLESVSTMYMPVASGFVARNYRVELKNMYRSTTKWLFIFTLPLFLIFFLFPSQILGLAFGGDYPTAARALQLICLGDFFHTLLGPNGMTLVAYGRSSILMLVSIIATLINVVLNIFLIPRWGITGAATASFIALALVNALQSIYLFKDYRIHPFGSSYAKPVLILMAVSAVLYYPLLQLLSVSRWFLLTYYPLFLALGLGITYISKSLEPTDRILLAAAKRRLLRRKGS
jgi:O-antigen/teichoic acid export membrane protein